MMTIRSERRCKVCGCTENNCSRCVKKTGKPCHWVEPDLCSACSSNVKADIKGLEMATMLMTMSCPELLAAVRIAVCDGEDAKIIEVLSLAYRKRCEAELVRALKGGR